MEVTHKVALDPAVDRSRHDVVEFLAAIAPLVYSAKRMPDTNWTFQLAYCGVSSVEGERLSEQHGRMVGELGTHPPIRVEMTTSAHREGLSQETVVYTVDSVQLTLK